MRTPGAFQWMALAFYLWFCCSYFWTIDAAVTLEKMRAYFQEMMIVWLVWEFADTPADLRDLLRAYVAGSWVLAILTLAAFSSPEAIAAGQIRFAAYGQDPNEVARFLDLGFPLAALLVNCERRWPARVMASDFCRWGSLRFCLPPRAEVFLPLSSRWPARGSSYARSRKARRLPRFLRCRRFSPHSGSSFPARRSTRLATIPEQLAGGDLNQRFNIWSAGWRAFVHAPLLGTGAGTFVAAAHLSPIDTAHNTVLSIAVQRWAYAHSRLPRSFWRWRPRPRCEPMDPCASRWSRR